MFEMPDLHLWLQPALLALGAVLAALLAHRIVRPLVRRLLRHSVLAHHVLQRVDRPLQWVVPLAALQMLWQGLPDAMPSVGAVRHVNGLLLIATLTWAGMRAMRGLADAVVALHPADVEDNLQARRIHTQTRVLSRIAMGVLLLAGIAFLLMTFPRARQFGASLLASAGVAGLVIGLAAKSVFSNLLAGLQIALAQPIRIDDVLIVEGEWGRVEEIGATYVVMKLWDERRLVVPLQWFIDHPFQNWTRNSADILGTAFLWVDPTLDLEPLRREAERVCKASRHWDGRVCLIQVTDMSERAMQLRVLVSSRNAGASFDLRCELREALIAFIARTQPQALARLRVAADATEPPAVSPHAAPVRPRVPAAAPGR
jgi:small-conductance mechanosensitive channel